jgi:hypothetical protein
LRNIPDLAKAYLFDVSIYNKKTKRTELDLNIRCKRVTFERNLYFDEYQDFYVSRYFDNLDDDTTFKVTINFYDSKLQKVVYKKVLDNMKFYREPFMDLDQTSSDKIQVLVKMIEEKQ